MVTAAREPKPCATVRVVPHSVALGQQKCLTVKVQMPSAYVSVGVGVLPVDHPDLSSDDLDVPGDSDSALYNGCSWYTYGDGSGHFYYSRTWRVAPAAFVSGDEVSTVVDRRTHSDNGSGNGVVRFLRNGKALPEAEPLPIGFAREAVLVVNFCCSGGREKIVSIV